MPRTERDQSIFVASILKDMKNKRNALTDLIYQEIDYVN